MNADANTGESPKLHGILAAMVTPMTPKEKIDFPRLAAHADWLIASGIHGLVALGSTGEFYALSVKERRDVVKATIEAAAGRVPVVVGVNAGSTQEVIAHARYAQRCGAAGVLAAPPYYSLPTPDELAEHFRDLNKAVRIPIMLYNYPARAGVDMPPEFILKLAKLSRVRYVKDSTGEPERMTKLLAAPPPQGPGVFCGCDTLALQVLSTGGAGWVSGSANILPREHAELYEAVRRGDQPAAGAIFNRLLPLLTLLENSGRYTQFVKAACALAGHDAGPPRRPLRAVLPEDCAQLREALGRTVNE